MAIFSVIKGLFRTQGQESVHGEELPSVPVSVTPAFNRADLPPGPATPSQGWPIKEEKISIPLDGKPEKVAITLLTQGEWAGCHAEGRLVRGIFRTLILPDLVEANPFKCIKDTSTPYMHAIHRLIGATAKGINGIGPEHELTPEQFIDHLHNTIYSRLKLPASALQHDLDEIARRCAILASPPLPEGMPIAKFLSSIHQRFWHDLLDIYATEDERLAFGWPDLEISDGKSFNFVEVKVNDRLTAHQRETIPLLMDLGLTCRIVRLVNP